MKKQIKRKALYYRIQRGLELNGKTIKLRRRDDRDFMSFGRYYIVDHDLGQIVMISLDLAEYGREHGYLKSFEEIDPNDMGQF